MALQDYYNTGDDSIVTPYGANTWFAQTFTASSAYTLSSVKLLVYRVTTPGTVTVELQGVTGDSPPKPDGNVLATTTFDADTLTTNTAGEWKEITFGSPYGVSSGTRYAIVVKSPNSQADGTPRLAWRNDGSSPTYANGNTARTIDAGSSWTDFVNNDGMFETWGTAAAVEYDEGIKIVAGAGVVSLGREGYRSPGGWPFDRFSDYDEDKYWDEANEQWVTSYVAGHGSRVDHVIFIGDQGEISFLEV